MNETTYENFQNSERLPDQSAKESHFHATTKKIPNCMFKKKIKKPSHKYPVIQKITFDYLNSLFKN